MPQRRRLLPRCRYRDPRTGVRCTEGGVGQPPLCAPHFHLVRFGGDDDDRGVATDEFVDALLDNPRVQDLFGRLGQWFDGVVRRVDRQSRPEHHPDYRGPARGYYSEFPPRPDDDREPPGGPDFDVPPRRPRRRRPPGEDPRAVLGIPPDVPLTRELVKKHQRALADIHHPDRGGSVQAMQRINEAATALLAQLG